jgi:hypothetical protein
MSGVESPDSSEEEAVPNLSPMRADASLPPLLTDEFISRRSDRRVTFHAGSRSKTSAIAGV